jgi:Ca2+/Na+ antiporter
MSTACLKQSFRLYSGPALFLTVICLALGAVFLSVGAAMGSVFLLAGVVALTVFVVLGARDDCARRS